MLSSDSWPSAPSATSVARAAGRPVGSVGKVAGACVCSISVSLRCGRRLWHARRRNLRGPRAGCMGLDLVRDVGRVVLDEAEQRRAARVLPLQAERVEARDLGHATAMPDPAVLAGHWKLNPAVVVAETGRPNDGVDLQAAAVREGHGPA